MIKVNKELIILSMQHGSWDNNPILISISSEEIFNPMIERLSDLMVGYSTLYI